MRKRRIAYVLAVVMLLCVIIPTAALAASNPYKPLAGLKISFMGDSISTYTGWSDAYPIADESCVNRYGEAYYGPAGGDFHNTNLLVTDTWWHQAATELGAEILMSNAGNSTGVMRASYPSIPSWELYLQELRGYLHRPYYLGRDGQSPDIIAIYLGSADMAAYKPSQFGSVTDVDFASLIQDNGDGTFTYAEPVTVAEAYCIMFHKIDVTYPNAEVYILSTLPNAGGPLATGNKRLANCVPYNAMLQDLAEYHDYIYVDTFDEFGLDSDGDGVATQGDWDEFKTYFHNDPHPNAAGFDVITRRFVETVLAESRYLHTAEVETTAGNYETVEVDYADGTATAEDYVTAGGMTVDYDATASLDRNLFRETYTSDRGAYHAEGGSQVTVEENMPDLTIRVPLTAEDNDKTAQDETQNRVFGRPLGVIEELLTDPREDENDGIYDYTQDAVVRQSFIHVQTLDSVITSQPDTSQLKLQYLHGTVPATAENGFVVNGVTPVALPPSPIPPITEGYDYVYFGSDQFSRYYSAHAVSKPDLENFPDEEPIYTNGDLSLYVHADHNVFVTRKLLVPRMFLASGTVEGTYPARWEAIQLFRLCDKDGNMMTAYCADQTTGAVRGYSYRLMNPEDATHYTPTEAAMIRSIANHCYWAMEGDSIGSINYLRNELVASGQFTREEADAINPGMATTATQFAFWSNANVMQGTTFLNSYTCTKLVGINSSVGGVVDQEEAALLFKLYHYFMSLQPTALAYETSDTIINENHFLTDVQLHPTQRVADAPNNLDEKETNDVYLMDVSFALAVKPTENNGDDLTVHVYDDQHNEVAVGRLAGTLQEGEIQLVEEDGYYTFRDLELAEGTQCISFRLHGTQEMKRGAFLLVSEEINGETSQTMVTNAEGTVPVDVELALTFELTVEDERCATSHYWRTETTVPPTGDRDMFQWMLIAATMAAAAGLILRKRNAA